MKYKHIIFDMDGTLTESRSKIGEEMIEMLKGLLKQNIDVIVISGADKSRIAKQMEGAPRRIVYLSQCGNSCDLWENKLSQEQKDKILHHIAMLKTDYSYLFVTADENDLIQDRGCQITFSMVGHHADKQKKKEFDPKGTRRANYLRQLPFDDKELCAKVGGSTSIDYTLSEGTKGKNLKRLIEVKKWDAHECLYVGDAIHDNGNDGTVIGVIPNLARVSDPTETLGVIKLLL